MEEKDEREGEREAEVGGAEVGDLGSSNGLGAAGEKASSDDFPELQAGLGAEEDSNRGADGGGVGVVL